MLNIRTVFLTGGTGFIGMNIACKLLEEGWNVVMYARKAPKENCYHELTGYSGDFYIETGDVLDKERMVDLLKRYHVDFFVHGAAITPDEVLERETPVSIFEVNCIGLMQAMLAAKECGIKRFLYLGSISAYGSTAFQKEVLEEDKSKSDPHSLYEISKFAGERILLRLKKLYELDAVVARVGDVFGPWERYTGVRSHMSLIYQTTLKAFRGEEVRISRSCLQDWASGPDIAGEVLAILTTKNLEYDIYPFCSGKRWTLAQWCELLKNKFPAFSYHVVEKEEEANVRVNQKHDNAPMDISRLIVDTGYCPKHDSPEKAFACYMDWLALHPDFLV